MKQFLYKYSWLLCAGFVLYLSLIPPAQQSNFKWMQGFQIDKFFHALSHAIIIILYFYPKIAYQKLHSGNKTYFKFFLALIVFGISIELLQKYVVTNRHFDWLDIVANICGDIIGILIIKYLIFRLADK